MLSIELENFQLWKKKNVCIDNGLMVISQKRYDHEKTGHAEIRLVRSRTT